MNLQDKPLAASGLISYRYKGRYGYIMIGAKNGSEALMEAQRSLSIDTAVAKLLEVWNGAQYVPAGQS